MASGLITSWDIERGKVEIVTGFIFLGSEITVDSDYSHKIKRHLLLGRKALPNQKERHHFAKKGPYSQSYGFSSGHVWMWELDHKEGRMPKNWHFWIAVLTILESPLGHQGDQSCQSQRKSTVNIHWKDGVETEALIFWPPDGKSWLTGKDPDAGKDWRQQKWMTEDEMVGWHHWLNGHEFEQTPGDSEGQGSLACCSPWGLQESDRT